MLRHLLLQRQRRDQAGQPSQFEKGDLAGLKALINRARYLAFRYEVVIVQSGIGHANLVPQFLDVLGATELRLLSGSRQSRLSA
ncbi:hypothetical protein [Ensifer sp. LC163]|uniref:hypothetical protein n=1 Tax=Ensifer sp. LC163 TaxID=1120652 RepID=UPI0008133A70|nr:hypothetical protein [Ensifer sp. LC163]OCP37083.1 hypothetical protein BC360_07115 [Ensifer sp. LC163]